MSNVIVRRNVNPLSDFSDLFDAVFNDSFFTPSNTIAKSICSANYPYSDLSFDKDDESYIIEMDLPGYTLEDISIDYENGTLTISGEALKRPENRGYAKTGRKFASFSTSFTIDVTKYDIKKLKEKDAITMSNGVLTIKVPVKKDFVQKMSFGKVKKEKEETND